MERVASENHPLSSSFDGASSSTGIGASSSSDSGQHSRSPAASLIQSAARSILDEATPSTAFSDGDSCADGVMGTNSTASSASLASLQTKKLPALPDEQDRRRFVGCLAAILASAYDYDESDENMEYDELSHYSYIDEAEQSHQDGERRAPVKFAQSQSFEYSDAEDFNESSVSSGSTNDSRSSSSTPQRTASRKKPATSLWGTSGKAKAELARQRHRRRRYDTMCKMLLSSAEMLLLEASVSKAFIPMLEKVLVPPKKAKKEDKESTTRPPLWRNTKSTRSRSTSSSPTEQEKQSAQLVSTNSDSHMNEVNATPERDYLPPELDEDDILRPFLESMTPGAGFRCISLLLLQYLLTSKVGYDARVRHVIKKLGVVVLVHDMERDPVEHAVVPQEDGETKGATYYNLLQARATRKFESLEHSIARRLIRLSEYSGERKNTQGNKEVANNKSGRITRDQFMRGVKIGSAGILAGTLFAVTGGLAAPGIYAGLSAVSGAVAATSAVVTLTSTAVVTTIFGVGGGGLAAYKMNRRTQGITEFEFRKETNNAVPGKSLSDNAKLKIEAELFSTICFSGWLRDRYDFQRPWGVHPTSPRLHERLELLQRFYSIHSPDHVPRCAKILASWRGEEEKLWSLLRRKYGTDPDTLFPLSKGPRFAGALTLEQEEVLDQLFVELGYNSTAPNARDPAEQQPTPFERMRSGWKDRKNCSSNAEKPQALPPSMRDIDSMHGPIPMDFERSLSINDNEYNGQGGKSASSDGDEYKPPKHLDTVWDYQATYGGEMYTVRWESHLLKTICDCVMDMAMDVVSGATKQILKQTVLSTLIAAIAMPAYLVNVANMIDGDWTLAVERSDQAGKELARTLLFSRAGHRPVTLLGFSFGARIIYSCLKELARVQEEWEELQELKREGDKGSARCKKLESKFDGMREPASIVEDVVLMGLPNHLSLLSWKACRQIVAGRLVNCYSSKDLILSLMFQVKRISGNFTSPAESFVKPVCGTCPVLVPGVENIDVSDLVSGHQDYCLVTGKILERVRHGQPLRSRPGSRDYDLSEYLLEGPKKLEY